MFIGFMQTIVSNTRIHKAVKLTLVPALKSLVEKNRNTHFITQENFSFGKGYEKGTQ